VKNKTVVHNGNVRFDHFGRIVLDDCPTDHDHLVDPKAVGEGRPTCRKLLENSFREIVGKNGTLVVTISFYEES
jgi:hypothetical protein